MATKLSQHRAAKHLGIAASTLSSYVKRGIAPRHVDFYGVRYFEITDLDAWLNARRGGGQ
ncbi:helix-turn-helix transcriptional regulator [Nitrobacter sp.]|uniref:helix-turn-helix transcriptional regulator n=1 Tax=Nitrobacter sp. TaxID=29420 RepID=UPI0029CAAC51|nr:helix-turn-helix domain-containing protein [Nitrobacter sp.]